MATIYKTGTATVTNGSDQVVGDDTGWLLAGIAPGSILVINGYSAVVESVEGDEALTIAQDWDKSTATGLYTISRASDGLFVVDLYDRMTVALRTLSLAGIHPDELGTIAFRNTLAYGAEDKKIFLHAEFGQDFEYYIWDGAESGSWIGPFPVAIPPEAPADGIQSSNASIADIIQIDQSTYDALDPPDASTLYVII